MTTKNVVQKIIAEHLVDGEMIPGQEIALRIDQTLMQDATGTMACLQFEAMGIPRVRTELSVSYVDHNTLQSGPENADDHLFLQTFAAKHGIHFSRPGNGICHQVHLERFAAPGKTLLGSDSHTPTSGGMGMIAIGAGGLDVAVAMGGGPFHVTMPRIIGVRLTGRLADWVSAKDVILEVLRRLTVEGGLGRILEYYGPGVEGLSVYERATITNMGAELGATTSVFPSDENTRAFLASQKRPGSFREIRADDGATYDEALEINLSALEPLIACPHSPDNVKKVSQLIGLKVHQVAIGSCTNSSYADLMRVASVLKGRKVHSETSLVVSPGSRQVLESIARNGALADLIASGARILECSCGPCIGMGQAPPCGGVSVRTFNRNFEGRSGTPDAQIYLASPETAAACALAGVISEPRSLGKAVPVAAEQDIPIDDAMILPPADDPAGIEVVRGPNIKPLPRAQALPSLLKGKILLKVGDDITTDHILPGGTKVLPLRSNIPAISEFTFERVDKDFARRTKESGGGFVAAGANYGQGSSREHAALAPMYLGVRGVLAKSFARIHRSNLINFGLLPLTFADPAESDLVQQGDELEIRDVGAQLAAGTLLRVKNISRSIEFSMRCDLTLRERELVLAGGLLNYTVSGKSR
jgi:aconitate hydratase